MNSSGLHHRTESLIKVHTRPLGKTTKNPTCLVPLEGAIRLKLVLEDPLPSDNIGPRRAMHKVPGVILKKSIVFFLHSWSPMGISKSATEGLRHRRERHDVVDRGHPVAALRPSAHGVLDGHRRDCNRTLWQRGCWSSSKGGGDRCSRSSRGGHQRLTWSMLVDVVSSRAARGAEEGGPDTHSTGGM